MQTFNGLKLVYTFTANVIPTVIALAQTHLVLVNITNKWKLYTGSGA